MCAMLAACANLRHETAPEAPHATLDVAAIQEWQCKPENAAYLVYVCSLPENEREAKRQQVSRDYSISIVCPYVAPSECNKPATTP